MLRPHQYQRRDVSFRGRDIIALLAMPASHFTIGHDAVIVAAQAILYFAQFISLRMILRLLCPAISIELAVARRPPRLRALLLL